MPAFPHVLEKFAAKLAERGSQAAPRPIAILSAGMSFLTSIGRPTEDDVAVAGYIVAQFKLPDAVAVATSLGISAALVPGSAGRAGDAVAMVSTLARGTLDEATVAAVALYAWFVAHAQAGERTNADFLRLHACSATFDGSNNPVLAQSLVDAMDRIEITEAPATTTNKYLFSISIDLCGSTDAKTRVRSNSQGNQDKIDHYNGLIYQEFCRIERDLFSGLVSRYGTGRQIDPARLFTVKGIGDEMWTLCSASEDNVEETAFRLIDAATEVVRQCVDLAVPENDDDRDWTPDFEYGHVEYVQSPIKVFIDLVEHATSIGTIRDEGLREAIPDLLREFHRIDRVPGTEVAAVPDEQVAAVMRRLSLSTYEPIGRVEHSSYRTDFIGHEIDRFFRSTKAALPGTVSIGQALAEKLDLQFDPVGDDISQVLMRDRQPLRGGLPNEPLYARRRTLTEPELKGIGYEYETYNVFHPLTLKGNYVLMEAQKQNGGAGNAYDDTIKKLPVNMVDRLATKTVSDRAA